jgi:hypothetical protein
MNIFWDIVLIQLLSGQALAEPFQLPFAKHCGSARGFHDVPRCGVSPSAKQLTQTNISDRPWDQKHRHFGR